MISAPIAGPGRAAGASASTFAGCQTAAKAMPQAIINLL
jgi:hypothetical protein